MAHNWKLLTNIHQLRCPLLHLRWLVISNSISQILSPLQVVLSLGHLKENKRQKHFNCINL